MKALRHLSFQTRVLLTFILAVAVTSGLGYLLINLSVNRAFSDFAQRNLRNQGGVVVEFLSEYYAARASFAGLEGLLLQTHQPFPFLLADANGTIVAAADPRRLGERATSQDIAQGLPVEVDRQVVGTLIPEPRIPRTGVLEQGFLRAVTRSLLIAACLAALAGTLLAILLLRQFTGPVKRLDHAARQIASGDLGKRVEVTREDELGHLAGSFNAMAESLQKAEAVKRQMIADVAHELRTPISIVRAGLEGLRDGVLEPTAENFAALHDKTLLTTRLVADLQELALADAGALSLSIEDVPLAPILERIRATIGAQLEDDGVRFVVEASPGLPPVRADGHRVEEVILNLLSNASRYTPAGGTIRVLLERDGEDWLRVSVCDTGPGLASDELARVFERFYQSDRSRASGGAGLGLSIAKALVEAQQGRIWAENAAGGGACFRFTLPIARPAPR